MGLEERENCKEIIGKLLEQIAQPASLIFPLLSFLQFSPVYSGSFLDPPLSWAHL